MTISNNLEEYVLRLLETRPLESLLDESITQSVTKSLFELKKLDEAAVFDEASMLRNQIITLQQGAQNGGSALTMFSIAKSALNEQLNGLLNIDSSAMKYEKSSPFNENKQNDLDLIKKDLLAIDYISMQTQYNYIKLLDGSFIDKPLLIVPNDQKKVSINFESTNTEQLGKIYATTSTNITNDEAFSLTFNEQTFFSEELQLDGSYHLGTVAEEINEQFDGNLIASFKVSSLGSQSIEATSIDNLSINGIGFGDIEVLDNDSDGGLVAFINGKKIKLKSLHLLIQMENYSLILLMEELLMWRLQVGYKVCIFQVLF